MLTGTRGAVGQSCALKHEPQDRTALHLCKVRPHGARGGGVAAQPFWGDGRILGLESGWSHTKVNAPEAP